MMRLKPNIISHAIFPLLAGGGIYILRAYSNYFLPDFTLYNLPDALWLYAFISCIVYIWSGSNRITISLSIALTIASIATEYLQLFYHIPGTFDYRDILAYLLAFGCFLTRYLHISPKQT